MKINLNKFKAHYQTEISQAKANNYDAVMVPLECELDIYCLTNIEDEEHIFDIASDYGWDKFLLIDFINHKEHCINLYELEAA
jgi:hypothetical protein